MSKPKFSIYRMIKRLFIVVFILMSLILLTQWDKVSQLHSVVTLFDKEKIVANFSHMDRAFLSQPIQAADAPSSLSYSHQALPTQFEYRGKTTQVTEFLKRRATTALLVLKNNDITFEQYFLGTQATDKRISWSMAKSFVAILFGMQVDKNNIDINLPVAHYLPELAGSGYENVKIKHVLQMSSGVKWNEDYQDFYSDINKMGRVLAIGGSLDQMTSELTTESTPGQAFHYVSMDTHVIAMILRRVTGKSLVELVQTMLWNKVGMESDAFWLTDSQGAAFALGGLNATTRDYARFGLLLANNGLWSNEQLVSAQWLNEATTAQASYLESAKDKLGYGYQIWLPPQAQSGEYFCVGVYGQFIYVNQTEGVVIVKNSADKQFQDSLNSKQETIAFFREVVASLK